MGCASSSPLINGGGPGGIVGTAKETASKAANEVLHAGETAIHDVGEHVKEAVQNVTNEIGGVLGGKKAVNEVSNPLEQISKTDLPQTNGHGNDNPDYKIIPLKDPNKQIVDENLENIKNNILKKAQSFSDDTEQMADDIIKETEDLIRDAETVASDSVTEMTTRITSSEDGTIEILNLEEPEIERILDNEPKCPPTPEATMNSMVSSDVAEVFDSTPNDGERQSQDKKPEQGQDGSKREA
ncbi:uncharacterized protein LOC129768451 isoform X2 [Toxorhynchites rutilus septentrionalis]|uniref:uncharacterized protein LOC129768451 isoform X2 n=1 Tax=Toxorhynchites rutilus septentrionalis TaxID=329112 RepID=UPI00247AE1EE|nr:uncharacterized protein LOC129768451 isoform X2 [Toxorhynchites rutilus septentrionalis]